MQYLKRVLLAIDEAPPLKETKKKQLSFTFYILHRWEKWSQSGKAPSSGRAEIEYVNYAKMTLFISALPPGSILPFLTAIIWNRLMVSFVKDVTW